MIHILVVSFLSAIALSLTGCAASPGEQAALVIGIGFVRVRPPAQGGRFEMIGVAAVVHPAFTGIAAGAVAHQSIDVGWD